MIINEDINYIKFPIGTTFRAVPMGDLLWFLSSFITLTTQGFADVACVIMKRERRKWRNRFYITKRRRLLHRDAEKR
jgi:hypothetical protein